MPHEITENDESSIAPAKSGIQEMGKVADYFQASEQHRREFNEGRQT